MVDELEAVPNIPLVPDEELDALKIKISQIKSDIQREKVRPILESSCQVLWSLSTGQARPLSVLARHLSLHSWSPGSVGTLESSRLLCI